MSATLTFDVWSIDYYRTMASVASLGKAISGGTSKIQLAGKFWSVARAFKAFVFALENLQSLPSYPIEDLKRHVVHMRELHSGIAEILQLASRTGFTSRTLFSTLIALIRGRNAELEDFIDHFELSIDPSTHSDLAEAVAEYHRGETVSLESLLK
jgi:hypothetical protein